MLERLLLNLLFILLPLIVYQVFWQDRYRQLSIKAHRLLIAATGALSVALCMSYPIPLGEGYLYDLGYVPMVLCTYYCGPIVGAFLTGFLLAFRLGMGGTDLPVSLLIPAVLYLATVLLHYRYRKVSTHWKIALLWSAVQCESFVKLGLMLPSTGMPWREVLFIFMIGAVFEAITIALCVYMVEMMLHNVRIRKDIVRTEQLQAASQMAASMSHEIRNPLTVVRGFLQFMNMREEISPAKRKEYFRHIFEELDRTEQIIGNYLAFTRTRLDSLEKLDLNLEFHTIESILLPYARMQSVHWNLNLSDHASLWVLGERQQFQQCIVNLVKNGIEAMPEGGTMTIEAYADQKNVVILLSDTGIGMTSEEVTRLGMPYYSIEEKGTGMGTMVAFNIIKAMGGKVEVDSRKGRGTRITIRFPRAEEASPSSGNSSFDALEYNQVNS